MRGQQKAKEGGGHKQPQNSKMTGCNSYILWFSFFVK